MPQFQPGRPQQDLIELELRSDWPWGLLCPRYPRCRVVCWKKRCPKFIRVKYVHTLIVLYEGILFSRTEVNTLRASKLSIPMLIYSRISCLRRPKVPPAKKIFRALPSMWNSDWLIEINQTLAPAWVRSSSSQRRRDVVNMKAVCNSGGGTLE